MFMPRFRIFPWPVRRPATAFIAVALAIVWSGAANSHAEAAPIADPVLGQGKVSADFNGDGYSDLAVLASATYDEESPRSPFATVTILYGSSSGLTTSGRQVITGQDMPDVKAQTFPFNPSTVVAGDFNGDGASELALGWGRAKVGSVAAAGAVYVIPGSSSGLRVGATKVWSQARSGVRGTPEVGDGFGEALAAADFGAGPEADLAIGVPVEKLGTRSRYGQGMVQVVYGSARGLTAVGDQSWSQDSPGVPGVAESKDLFGSRLAAGDFDGRHHADLAISAPSETVNKGFRGGAVTVLYSAINRLSATGSQGWSQDSPGIAGIAQHDDSFGASLATGRITGATRDDLAVGAPGEESSTHPDHGVVHLLPSSPAGLTATGSQVWTLPKLGGSADIFHYFGEGLLVADFGGNPGADHYGDLLIGTRGRVDLNPPTSDYLLYGSPTGIGRHDLVVSNDDFAAADFDTRAEPRYADLVTVRADDAGLPVLDVYRGTVAGLKQDSGQRFTLTDLGLPDAPPGIGGAFTLHASAAGSP